MERSSVRILMIDSIAWFCLARVMVCARVSLPETLQIVMACSTLSTFNSCVTPFLEPTMLKRISMWVSALSLIVQCVLFDRARKVPTDHRAKVHTLDRLCRCKDVSNFGRHRLYQHDTDGVAAIGRPLKPQELQSISSRSRVHSFSYWSQSRYTMFVCVIDIYERQCLRHPGWLLLPFWWIELCK